MLKLKCLRCKTIGYSASQFTRCTCGGQCEEIVEGREKDAATVKNGKY